MRLDDQLLRAQYDRERQSTQMPSSDVRRRISDAHPIDQPLPSVDAAWDLDDLEELDDARVLPALDRADFDGLPIGIPPFLIGRLSGFR